MSLPLYKDHRVPSPCPLSAHTGLWFDKFCDQWSAEWRLDSPAKLNWIRTVAKTPVGDANLLTEYFERLTGLARARGGEVFYFKTASRFATGLGREHPIENGFVWHPSLGTPCLPGSSVKGLVRAWAETWAEAAENDTNRIFGPRIQSGTQAGTGSVLFYDAIPLKPAKLSADVMTPHYGPYYQDGDVPGDWHSPVPIPFLTVGPGQSFLFALAPRTGADAADYHTAAVWLESSLIELGAGAKTAMGYGRFERDAVAEAEVKALAERRARTAREAEENAAFAASLASQSPLAGEFERAARVGKWDGDANAFKAPDNVENWLARLEADPQADAIARLRCLLDRHFSGLLANPDKTEGKKNRPAFKPRWVALAKRLNALPKP